MPIFWPTWDRNSLNLQVFGKVFSLSIRLRGNFEFKFSNEQVVRSLSVQNAFGKLGWTPRRWAAANRNHSLTFGVAYHFDLTDPSTICDFTNGSKTALNWWSRADSWWGPSNSMRKMTSSTEVDTVTSDLASPWNRIWLWRTTTRSSKNCKLRWLAVAKIANC